VQCFALAGTNKKRAVLGSGQAQTAAIPKWYREDLQHRQGRKNAFLCARSRETLHQKQLTALHSLPGRMKNQAVTAPMGFTSWMKRLCPRQHRAQRAMLTCKDCLQRLMNGKTILTH
jgi:hypothetical protein